MGAARRSRISVPRLLDRRTHEDGLQATVPAAGRIQRPSLATPAVRCAAAGSTQMKWRLLGACAMAVLAAGCLRINVQGEPTRALERHALEKLETIMRQATPLRVATYNTSLYSDEAGGLVRRLEGDDANARRIA